MYLILLFIFVLLFFYLARPSKITQIIRNKRPNFDKAVTYYPPPKDINKCVFFSKKYKLCMLQDDISKGAHKFKFRLAEEGLLVREFIPWYLGVKPKAIFIPRNSLIESKSAKRPRNISWYWGAFDKKIVRLEIKNLPIILFIRKRNWIEKELKGSDTFSA